MNTLANDSRVFKIDPSISVQSVRFRNRFGIVLAGHLYLPKNFDDKQAYPAIVISGPFGAVKEQSSGLYAQTLAQRGFVTLAFDQSFTGESSGEVRNVASPDVFTEDFSAAVDFVGLQKFVDRERIGAIGICGLGSHVLTAASIDKRIKAVATSVMYDMSSSIWDGVGKTMTDENRESLKDYLARRRWIDAENGTFAAGAHEVMFDQNGEVIYMDNLFPDKLPENPNPVLKAFFDYYRGRAYHPRSINSTGAWTSTTPWSYFNFKLEQYIDQISPRPSLIVTGENAHSRYFAEEAYEKLKDPKEIVIVPNADHVDLYDQMDKIPFDKFDEFFKENL
ncbi:membrane protein [Lactobacillus nasalidis]|uniref:Membrane protein n=1 Tax=Lactobacillus nasalidis TaxID=2797258 RepID=A0ABQ3W2K9_9LACO|nr:alpha/beta hydrolase [Lactobacillus nasalidis]GHV97464.1 membrane protein [Lactobacillus nasalidis]GHV99515.1 membrane protein [Lactobacillus nasalidis]GHW00326.1 membrane protein [Lactobacillus nasalidis]